MAGADPTDGDRRGGHRAALGARERRRATGSRRSIRLAAYNYATPGTYFITICTNGRLPLLASQQAKSLVLEAWYWLPKRFRTVQLDEFVIMPDHVHFVLTLLSDGPDDAGGHPAAQGAQPRAPTLGNVVGAFKTVAARAINARDDARGRSIWQRNYYEHIVRDEKELLRIRDYIQSNPLVAHEHDARELEQAWK